VSYAVNWQITLKSWDRFIIPMPFARCVVRLGTPVRVPAGADETMRERVRAELQGCLAGLGGAAG